ncbi:THUMP-like domain-containing protein [Parafrankia sp. FMc2]|uniref:THUMP-like domain-containing protein n=1 Tax=Parafrankia sp. FMc2 TaxID=3233196 RepID=UPI0034D6D799
MAAAGGTAAVDDTAARLTTFEALLSPLGTELLATAAAALARGSELADGTRLRAAGHPPELVAAAFGQAELRSRAAAKFPAADQMFFTRPGLEQASSHRAAAHRAARFAGRGRLADLCTGIGGDLIALAAEHPVLAVDRDPLHLRMAVHNAEVAAAVNPVSRSGVRERGRVEPCEADVREVDLRGVDGVFVDPARRGGDQRMATGTSEPPLGWCFALVDRVEAVAIKAAPGLRLDVVPPGWEIEFVADGRGLKESVLFAPALATAPRRATVLLRNGEVATLTGEPDDPGDRSGDRFGDRFGDVADDALAGDPAGGLPLRPPGPFILDPSPAVTRAGLVGTLGRLVDGWQIDPRIAFLGVDRPVATPFARVLRVEAEMAFDVRRVAAAVRAAGVSALDVRRRGLAGDVDAIRRRLLPARRHLVPRGPAMTVLMTRVRDAPWAILCTELTAAQTGQAEAPEGVWGVAAEGPTPAADEPGPAPVGR